MPFGAWNLCPEIDSRSTGTFWTSIGIFPATWTASVCIVAPASFAISAICWIGNTVPVSLFAHMVETSAFLVSFSSLRSWSRLICPMLLTGSSISVKPWAFKRRDG